MEPPPYIISTDGRTVWVNGPGSLLGRFGIFGIDIHRAVEEQHESGECLLCTTGETTRDDWDLFVAKMKEFYNVEIHPRYTPHRFRKLKSVK